MRIECPFCNEPYEVKPEYIGTKTKCPTCDEEFEIRNPNLTACSDCFSMISKRASVCPHCGAPQGEYNYIAKKTAKTQRAEAEKTILICNPSKMNYFWTIIFGIITIPVVVGIFILLFVWVRTQYTMYHITNLRIIVTHGWITKSQTEIWIKDMRGASLSQNVWQRIIGVGDIAIGTAATAGTEICIAGVCNPEKVVNMINSLRL